MCADDIPIQADEAGELTLGSITEEHEDSEKSRTRSGSSALKHLPKLPGLGKKPKANKNSPISQRNSLEVEPPFEMHLASGDQVSLVSGAFSDGSEQISQV